MKIPCEIIRDILPLYAEDMVSQPTRAMVEEHLGECENCTRELEAMKNPEKPLPAAQIESLKRVKDTIRHRRVFTVLTAILLIVTFLFGGALLLDAPIYLSADQAIESVEALEDGTIRIHPTDIVTTTGSCVGMDDDGTLSRNYGVIYSTNLYMLLFPKEITPYEKLPEEIRLLVSEEDWGTHKYQWEGGASSYNFWYVNAKDGTVEALLWDAGNPRPQVPLKDVNYTLAYYVGILAVICVVFMILERTCGKYRLGKVAGCFAVWFGSVAISVVIVTAGQFEELWGKFTEAFRESIFLAIPMSLCVLCVRKLIRMNKQDKGI